jgi:leucyl-tRNA synthetase
MKYDPSKIESKWQKIWAKKKVFQAQDEDPRPKYYALFEFPYPSGDGLHVGHLRPYVGMDVIARKRRLDGYNVLYPIGWDSFGLPTENYAIKHNIDPAEATKQNTKNFKRQMQSIGLSLDWSRELDTTDPKYYKWTQWMFLKFFEKGLAYKAKTFINWCPKDKIGLANEEAAGGVCDRCGGPVEKREKEQWLIRITDYADKLLAGLDEVDYIPQAKIQQQNWIGRSEGAEIEFPIVGSENKIKVFTTRPDTIFGATYLVIAPEHRSLAFALTNPDSFLKNKDEVQAYVDVSRKKSEMERTADNKDASTGSAVAKTGVELKGLRVINPATKEEIPVWTSDYVLVTYGTGAIMAVPQHDERDRAFAEKFKLPIVDKPLKPSDEVISLVGATKTVKYKLRDWVFSRQRYWGEPIPLVFCPNCAKNQGENSKFEIRNSNLPDLSAGERLNPGWVAVPEKDLPVKLPKVKNYQPRDDGQSPLASVESWVNTKCPTCKGPAKRETDTMPNWAGSSWYFLRYIDPKNKKAFADKEKLKHWMPVDWYNGGMEHTVLHLLYSRFWNRFLHELGYAPTAEPYKKRTSHALILAEGGVKMSKSKGNVINPDTLVKEFGADALRVYEMFIGPFTQAVAWDQRGILGTYRFLDRIWRVGEAIEQADSKQSDGKLARLLHKTIKKVGADIEQMNFNTAVSTMMIFVNELDAVPALTVSDWQKFLLILAPFAPHIAEELWQLSGDTGLACEQSWPSYDESMLVEDTFEMIIQVNGRVRSRVMAKTGIDQPTAEKLALADRETKKWVSSTPKKVIFVPNRLINFIV